MATDGVADIVLSVVVHFEIFGAEDTDSDKDAKELCTIIRRHRQRPAHHVNCRRKARAMRDPPLSTPKSM